MRKVTTMIVVVLIVAAAAFFGGYWYGSQRYAASNVALTDQAAAAQRRLDRVGNLNHLLNARLELYKAASQLDQRNFGLANTHLRNTAAALNSVDATAVGIDAAAFGPLSEAVGKMDITVAVDLEAQRAAVLRFGSDLDALLPRNAAPSTPVSAPAATPPSEAPPPEAPVAPETKGESTR